MAVVTPFQTVQANGRQMQRSEQRIELGEVAAADQRQRTVEAAVQDRQGVDQAPLDRDVTGAVGEIEQGAVDVEEQGPVGRDRRRQRQVGRREHTRYCEQGM